MMHLCFSGLTYLLLPSAARASNLPFSYHEMLIVEIETEIRVMLDLDEPSFLNLLQTSPPVFHLITPYL